MGFSLKKLAKGIVKGAGDVVKGGAKAVSGAVEMTVVNPIRAAGNIGSGLLTGNTDKVTNSILRYGKDQFQSAKAISAGGQQAAAGGLTVGTGGVVRASSKGGILGDTRTAGQVRADDQAAEVKAEEKRLADEEAARPEKERQDFFNRQYENSLLKNKGRGYNSLLGGGY